MQKSKHYSINLKKLFLSEVKKVSRRSKQKPVKLTQAFLQQFQFNDTFKHCVLCVLDSIHCVKLKTSKNPAKSGCYGSKVKVKGRDIILFFYLFNT